MDTDHDAGDEVHGSRGLPPKRGAIGGRPRKSKSKGGIPAPVLAGGALVLVVIVMVALAGRGGPAPVPAPKPETQTSHGAAPPPPDFVEVTPIADDGTPTETPTEKPSKSPDSAAAPDKKAAASSPPIKLRRKQAKPAPEAKKDEGVDTRDAEALVLKQMQSFLKAMTGKDEKQARASLEATFANKYDAETIFGSAAAADVWAILENFEKEILQTREAVGPSLEPLIKNPKLLRAQNARRAVLESPDQQAALSMIRTEFPVVELSASINGKSGVMFLFVALNDKTVRALPPFEHLASELVKKNALVRPQKEAAPLVALETAGEAFLGDRAGAVRDDNAIQLKLVWCPSGRFTMGTDKEALTKAFGKGKPATEDEVDVVAPKAVKVVLTDGFWIGQTEVTEEQFEAVMESPPVDSKGKSHPAAGVPWKDAVEFCKRLTQQEREAKRLPEGWEFALPTEAQWEYACRAGSTAIFPWGDDAKRMGEFVVSRESDSIDDRQPVATKKPNSWGLQDMLGNVAEWCADIYDDNYVGGTYPLGPSTGKWGTDGYVVRGGQFVMRAPEIRSACRDGVLADAPTEAVGFRVAVVRSHQKAATDEASPTEPEMDLPPLAVAPFDSEAARKSQEEWAASLGVPVEYTNPLGMKFVLIPPGEYMRGSPNGDTLATPAERPQHRVRLTHPFYLSTTEVTQKQFRDITGQTPSYFRAGGGGEARARGLDLSDRPVDTVSWVKAAQFCQALQQKFPADVGDYEWSGYRLPSEAEWEFACRAGTTTRWSFGDDPAKVGPSVVAGLASQSAVPPAVGGKPANAFGLYDMHGSIYEWCADAFDDKAYAPLRTQLAVNPFRAPDGERRVARGSSWDIVLTQSRAAGRLSLGQHDEGQSTGFRVALGLADAPFLYETPAK